MGVFPFSGAMFGLVTLSDNAASDVKSCAIDFNETRLLKINGELNKFHKIAFSDN